MPKTKLRKSMLEKRKKLSAEERKDASFHIQQTLLGSEVYISAKNMVLYSAIHNEVDFNLVINDALTSGREVFLPVVAELGLIFRQVKDACSLRKGSFGILEPPALNSVISLEKVDMVVVPGIAFDLQGQRVGYGKGFYDKVLHALEGSGKLIAVCYDFQLVDDIAGEPHDVLVDMIITEKRIVRPLRNGQ
jgi:5-formyltetrahydrofolate cyclo-ligase